MNIYVGNLGYDVTDNELQAAFEAYGEVESARIITDRDTGRSKGFGFVEMPEKKEALKAIEGLNETELGGRNISVNEARPKPKRESRCRFGGGYGGGHRSESGGGRSDGYGGRSTAGSGGGSGGERRSGSGKGQRGGSGGGRNR
jgi:RNA recognition motif-containing protein